MKKYSIRSATEEELTEFLGFLPGHLTRSWVAEYEGKIAALVTVEFRPGGALVFSDIKKGLNIPKMTIWRAALEFEEKVKSLSRPLTAICTGDFLNSPKMLRVMGFELSHISEGQEVYTWQP